MQDTAYNDIYSAFAPKLKRYLNSYFNNEDSEDLMQEIFVKIHKALPSFRGESSLNTWLYRIATNSVTDKFRSKAFNASKLQQELTSHAEEFNNSHFANTFERQIEKGEMNSCIRGFISELTEKNKSVFVLSIYEGLSNQEIASVLSISVDSVKIRLHRAKDTLKCSLAKNCNIYVDEYGDMACDPRH